MRSRERVVLAFAVGAVLASAAAEAQVLEEVVVTAQKRQQSLQDVGISVSAFSGEQLEGARRRRARWTSRSRCPACSCSRFPRRSRCSACAASRRTTSRTISRRPVAVYMDGAYVASMNAINTQLFDMDRVEVLRGPQGTLFGRNATGGLIHFLTRKADEDGAERLSRGGRGRVRHLQCRRRGRRRLLRRGARPARRPLGGLRRLRRGGHRASDEPPRAATRNGADGYALRGTLQIDATDDVAHRSDGAYSRDRRRSDGRIRRLARRLRPGHRARRVHRRASIRRTGSDRRTSTARRSPATARSHWSDENPYFDREMTSLTAQVTAQLGGAELVSITNWLDDGQVLHRGRGRRVRVLSVQHHQRLRAVVAGVPAVRRARSGCAGSSARYYLDMTWDTFQSVQGALILGGTSDTQIMSTFGVVDSRNWSAFGQVEFDLAERWTVIAGLRWSQDDKDLDMRRVYEDVPEGVPPTEKSSTSTMSRSRESTPSITATTRHALQLNFKPVDGTLLYASFNRGIKGGNWSLDPLGGVPDENLQARRRSSTHTSSGSRPTLRTAPRGSTRPRSTTTTTTTSRSRSWV